MSVRLWNQSVKGDVSSNGGRPSTKAVISPCGEEFQPARLPATLEKRAGEGRTIPEAIAE